LTRRTPARSAFIARYFYNDREGYLETFRPYALPGNDWIEEAARQLKRLLG